MINFVPASYFSSIRSMFSDKKYVNDNLPLIRYGNFPKLFISKPSERFIIIR